ncbi:MAG: hypothetical protein GKR91_12440 [Pseudomonadales bacterium]|nr:hypothetical protein [Pseudomonadales bacterium]
MTISFSEHAPWLKPLEKIPVSPLNFALFTVAWVIVWLGVEYLAIMDGEHEDRFTLLFQSISGAIYAVCFFSYPFFLSLCQKDLSTLARWDRNVVENAENRFGKVAGLLEALFAILINLLLVSAIVPQFMGYSFSELLTGNFSITDKISGSMVFGSYLIANTLLTFAVLLIFRFSWLMTSLAGRVDVVLLRVRELVVFSNMFLRVLGLSALMTSLGLFNLTLVDLDYAPMVLIIIAIALPSLLITVIPCIRIASRIKQSKNLELARIGVIIDERLDNNVEDPATSKDLADVLAYEQRVQDIWEWPFETQIKKIFFFVLMPPLFWLLGVFGETVLENVI